MPQLQSNDINDAKRRVEEMRKRAMDYVADEPPPKNEINQNQQSSSSFSFLNDILGGLFGGASNDDSSFGLILAIILILSKEGADNKLILALLYILL